MVREILKVLGGMAGLILRFVLIIALSVGGLYSLGSALMFPFIWAGLLRAAIAVLCGLAVFGLIRLGRDKDDAPEETRK